MFRRFSTRGRVILSCLITAVVLFILISPLATIIYQYIFAPGEVKNLSVTQKSNEINLSWDRNQEYDLSEYRIQINGGEEISLEKEKTSYSFYDLNTNQSYSINFYVVDSTGKTSALTNFEPTTKEQSETFIVNQSIEADTQQVIFTNSIILAVILLVLNLWVLFFKVSRDTLFSVALLPSMASIPFLIFSQSLLFSVNNPFNKLILSIGIVAAFAAGNYLLLLTSNILNGSFFSKIPLEQAGKAAQFIFSLIATYLIMIYAFGAYQNFALRLITIIPFVYYFCYSSIWSNKNANQKDSIIRSVSITLVMVVAIIVLSIWPIESVYAILSLCVIFYILLNMALELRSKLGRAVWVEYGVLTLLIIFLLFSNGVWGINGSLL